MIETQTKAELAAAIRDKLGISAGHASDVANKKTPPSLKLALRIQKILGVPVEHWADATGGEQ